MKFRSLLKFGLVNDGGLHKKERGFFKIANARTLYISKSKHLSPFLEILKDIEDGIVWQGKVSVDKLTEQSEMQGDRIEDHGVEIVLEQNIIRTEKIRTDQNRKEQTRTEHS